MLLLDLLAGAHGYVKDVAITAQLGVSGKVANRALRYLQAEGLLASGALPWVLVVVRQRAGAGRVCEMACLLCI